MNLTKIKFTSYIYILFLHRFSSVFVKFLLKSCKISGERRYKPTRLVIKFNSRLYDMTSIERYVGQSAILFIRDVAYA